MVSGFLDRDGAFAAPPALPTAATPEFAGRQWAQAWLEQARDRYNPVQPVNLKGTPEEAEFDLPWNLGGSPSHWLPARWRWC